MVLIANAITTMHIAGGACNIEGLTRGVALKHGDHLGGCPVFILKAAYMQAG